MNWRLIAFGFIGYYALQYLGTQVGNRLNVGKPRIKVKGINATGIRAMLFLPVTNTNPASLPVEAFQGQILYGTYPLSDLYLNSPTVIQANETTELQFDIIIDTSRFTGSVVDLVNSGQLLQSLRLKGHLKSAGVVFPIERTLQLFGTV